MQGSMTALLTYVNIAWGYHFTMVKRDKNEYYWELVAVNIAFLFTQNIVHQLGIQRSMKVLLTNANTAW